MFARMLFRAVIALASLLVASVALEVGYRRVFYKYLAISTVTDRAVFNMVLTLKFFHGLKVSGAGFLKV